MPDLTQADPPSPSPCGSFVRLEKLFSADAISARLAVVSGGCALIQVTAIFLRRASFNFGGVGEGYIPAAPKVGYTA